MGPVAEEELEDWRREGVVRVVAEEERRWRACWRVFCKVRSLSVGDGVVVTVGAVLRGLGWSSVGREPLKEFLRIPKGTR